MFDRIKCNLRTLLSLSAGVDLSFHKKTHHISVGMLQCLDCQGQGSSPLDEQFRSKTSADGSYYVVD